MCDTREPGEIDNDLPMVCLKPAFHGYKAADEYAKSIEELDITHGNNCLHKKQAVRIKVWKTRYLMSRETKKITYSIESVFKPPWPAD
jgi:hypothetical protein